MHINKLRFAFLVVAVQLVSTFTYAQTTADAPLPGPGKPIERELRGGDVHTYAVQLTTGQFLEVIVDQRGIDVVVSISGPDGQKLEEVDSPTGAAGIEAVSALVQSTGLYRVEVRALEKSSPAGRYEIKVETLRDATAEDLKIDRIKALAESLKTVKSEEEGHVQLAKEDELITVALWKRLSSIGKTQRPREALITHTLALRVAERITYREGIAESLHDIGTAYYNQDNLTKALEHYQKSLPLSEQLAEKRLLATVLVNIGAAYLAQRNPALALEHFERVLKLNEVSKGTGVITARRNIGAIYREQGNYDAALENFNQALRLSEERQLPSLRAGILIDIGRVYKAQGNQAKALEVFQQALSLGETLNNQTLVANSLVNIAQLHQDADRHSQAQDAYQRSLVAIEASENKAALANALANMGWASFLEANYPQALRNYTQALNLAQELGNKNLTAQVLNNMSLAYRVQGDFAKALEHAQKSLSVSETLGSPVLLAHSLMGNGLAYDSIGDKQRALEFYQRSLAAAEEAKGPELIANALEKLGGAHHAQGNIAQAIEFYQKSLGMVEAAGIKRHIIFTVQALASVYRSQGNYSEAARYYRRGLKLSEEIGNKFQIATALNTLGIFHTDQGDYAQALKYFHEALKVREEIGQVGGVANSLNNIGEVYRLKGEPSRAMEYYQKSLALYEKLGTKQGLRVAFQNIGETHRLLGNYKEAMESCAKALRLMEEAGIKLTIPETLNSMSAISFATGNYKEAVELSTRSADLARQLGHRDYLRTALTLSGRAYQALNQPDEARRSFEEAIAIIESLRSTVAGQESRATYFAMMQQPYELYVDLMMQRHRQDPAGGFDRVALEMNERAKARSLFEALGEARANIRQGVDQALLENERTAQQRLNAAAERQMRLMAGKHTQEQAARLQKEIELLTVDLQNARTEIRQKSPRYAALTQPVPLGLIEVQKLLDSETLLLNYALGPERSYLWVVSPTSLTSFELAKRSEIETQVRGVLEMLSDGKSWATSTMVNARYETAIAGLSGSLLPSTLVLDPKVKRLVIVADGALQYLPFTALRSPKFGAKHPIFKNNRAVTENAPPLIADFEIVSLPSASTLAILRREPANRGSVTGSVAVLADPVFEETDQRVLAAISQNKSGATTSVSKVRDAALPDVRDSRAILERAFRVDSNINGNGVRREVLRISRLPFTRFEAEGILASAQRTQSFKATDFRANRETATGADLSKYRFIHFATHGILNTEHPELSGVVLSLVDEKGQPVDGFLRLHDIYNLNLPADLVVLSACQTGLGKEIRGEGLVGLTRGFMYAGSPRVVASLWKVDDAATAELMKRFYRGMLRDKLRPAAALRLAKIEMWKQKRWNAPFYWAAFELQGEWK